MSFILRQAPWLSEIVLQYRGVDLLALWYSRRSFTPALKPPIRRGRQRETWGKVFNGIFLSLGLDKREWLEDGNCSLASFMSCV